MGQRLTYWVFLGTIGLASFFLFRPVIDFNAGAPIEESRATVEERTGQLSDRLGFSADSLRMLSLRTQHLGYYKKLKDSLGSDLPSPSELHQSGANLSGWDVMVGQQLSEDDFLSMITTDDLFNKTGRLRIRYGEEGKVRRITTHPENPNPTFVAGDSLSAIAQEVVNGILGYDLSAYTLNYVDVRDTLISTTEPGFRQQELNLSNGNREDNTVFKFNWSKSNPSVSGPDELSLDLKPMIKEIDNQQGTSIRYGAAVEQFLAMDGAETKVLDSSAAFSNLEFIISFASLVTLVILVFFQGIKNINKGHVEWKRAIFIMLSVAAGMIGWRAIYLVNTLDPFFNVTTNTVYLLNQLLVGGACGLYAAFAYVGWEALARGRNDEQLHLLDAYWRKRFFFRETGDSLIRGYALGGVLLGLFALGLFALDTVFYQADSQFGFSEASMQPKLLTINMGAWINVWLVSLGHIGVTVGMLRNKVSRQWQLYLFGTIVSAFLFAGSAALIGISGPIWYDLIIFGLMAPAMIFVFDKAGLLTFSTGWWIFAVILMILPYWGSSSFEVSYVAWLQGFILLLPLIYGFIAYRYGNSVSELGGYIPEYQERIANHLRVEKEIEIARESQFKLMPLKPPAIKGIDVYGFFMPSFEVGGDYFDYVVNKNGKPEPEALTMTIADVSGKAMKAAMHAVFTSGLLLSRLHRDSPESILQEVAPTIYSRTDPQTFITCIIAQYHLKDRTLTIANAGHCLPIVKRKGKAEFIKTPDPKYPLGLRTDVSYQSLVKNLEEGDFLLLYSDGLPEAVDPAGNRFGYENLIELVESLDTDAKSSNEIALEIKRRVQKFSDYQLADDTTIICLKV